MALADHAEALSTSILLQQQTVCIQPASGGEQRTPEPPSHSCKSTSLPSADGQKQPVDMAQLASQDCGTAAPQIHAEQQRRRAAMPQTFVMLHWQQLQVSSSSTAL